jgi:hypothetical protein
MKHFILKNEIIITLVIKGGGENYNFQCYLFLNSSYMKRISNDIFYKTKNTGDFK